MRPSDPFPLERCSSRLRLSILREFQGRHPTLREVASIPPQKWLTAPGIGPASLVELEAIIREHQDWMTNNASSSRADAELADQLERMQHDLKRLRCELRSLIDEIRKKKLDPGSLDQS